MVHNDEKDAYRNNSLIAKYETNFNENIKFETNLRFRDSYLQYDKSLIQLQQTIARKRMENISFLLES